MNPISAIRTARVPHGLAGSPRLRAGLEHWLGECDPARHGLPGDAIVLVRHLRTHWSVVLAPDPAQRYAPLGALVAGARRAATADADADVVWFADEAELLACLARDALAGLLPQRWWWRSLQHGLAAGTTLASAHTRWLQTPKQVPRAVRRLGAARAVAWLESLGDAGRAQMVDALAEVFSVAQEAKVWVLEGRLASAVNTPAPALAPVFAPVPGSASRVPLWAAQAADAALRLHRLCAALAEDAAAARSPASLQALADAAWRPDPARHTQGPQAAPKRMLVLPPAAQEITLPVPQGSTAMSEMPVTKANPAEPQAHVPGPLKPATGRVGLRPAETPPTVPSTPTAHQRRANEASVPAVRTEALEPAPPRTLLATRYGGLLFLLNAALQLSLYGDFTQPRHPGLDCPPWRFLLLAGRAWCGPGFRRDPLYGWLLRRAGGARQPVPLHLWPQLHARLVLALSDGPSPRRALRAMLGMPAKLQDTGERLDLFFALAELPLAVRLSGLDRDPGWIPAAGCDVRFHFD
jgi:hypothetical protein